MVFSQSCHVNGAALQICIVTLQDGNMNVVLSWQESVLAEDFVGGVASQSRACLLRLGKGSDEKHGHAEDFDDSPS